MIWSQIKLVQVAVRRKRYEVAIICQYERSEIQDWERERDDDLFPSAGLLNINQLSDTFCPRLRNNRAIILSRGNRAFVFCLVNMSYNSVGPHKKFIEFISPIVPVYVVLEKLTEP